MSGFVTGPEAYVAVYPFEGGQYILSGNNASLLDLSVSKNIRGQVGTFSMLLAPGGPYGLNARPSWTDLLTPMSLVVIGIARGSYREIVMIGVVQSCQETQDWRTNKGVMRTISVVGADFQYFFSLASYYTLSFLAGTSAAVVGGEAGLQALLSDSLLSATPNAFGEAWYKKIMAGPQSIMASLSFPYNGGRVSFYDMVAQFWEPYDSNIEIPFADYFMLSEGSWQQKFMKVFPFPFYEFFVTTCPKGYYPGTALPSPNVIPATTYLNLPGFPDSSPQIVARVNPLPWTRPTQAASNSGTFPQVEWDQSYWLNLPVYTTNENSGIENRIYFDDSEVRNFYVINPVQLSALFGQSNSSNSPFIYTFASFADVASIHRYGYRPQIQDIEWFYDSAGQYAQSLAAGGGTPEDFQTFVQQLALRQTSYFEPTPNMAKGQITMRLRPDIFPGTTFEFTPYKNQELWKFYIEGVSHRFTFGGMSTTTLTLSRGLPNAVYADSNLMIALSTGNAQRKDGVYQAGLPSGLGPPLTPVNYQNIVGQGLIGDIAQIFNKAQY